MKPVTVEVRVTNKVWGIANFISVLTGLYLTFTLGLFGLSLFYGLHIFICLFCSEDMLNAARNAKGGAVLLTGGVFLLTFLLSPIVSYVLIWGVFDADRIFQNSHDLTNFGLPQSGFTALENYVNSSVKDISADSKLGASQAEVLLGLLFHRMFAYLGIVTLLGITAIQTTKYSQERMLTRKLNFHKFSSLKTSSSLSQILTGFAIIGMAIFVEVICLSVHKYPALENFRFRMLLIIGIMFSALIIITTDDRIKSFIVLRLKSSS